MGCFKIKQMKKTAIFLFASMLSCQDLISQEVKSIERDGFINKHRSGAMKESDEKYVLIDYENYTNHVYAQKLDLRDMSLGERLNVSDPTLGNNFANGVFVKNKETFSLKTETVEGKSTVYGMSISTKESFPIHSIENVSGLDVVINHTSQSPSGNWSAVLTTSVMPRKIKKVVKSSPEFYRRNHIVTIFDENGGVAWQKQFYLGSETIREHVFEIFLSDAGELYIETVRIQPAYTYYHMKAVYSNISVPTLGGVYKRDVVLEEDIHYLLSQSQSDPNEIKCMDLKEYHISNDRSFYNERGFIRIATLLEAEEKTGISMTGGWQKFVGFSVCIMQDGRKHSIFIPIGAEDLRNEFSEKQTERLEKGKGITIGTPVPFFAHYSEVNGLYLFFQEFYGTSSSSGSTESYYNYLTIMNISDQGEVKWTRVNDVFQQIDLSVHTPRGGAVGYASEDGFVVVMNSAIRDDVKFMGNSTGKISTYYFDLQGKLQKTTKLDVVGAAFKPKESFAIGDNLLLIGNPIEIPMAKKEKASVSIIKP